MRDCYDISLSFTVLVLGPGEKKRYLNDFLDIEDAAVLTAPFAF